ncbi:Scr1 family TA system antitoxin-like transcriptional regulator [Streptomyces sp. NPDC058783]|uniref:Scr1 family TA system antitoxin-like transcriptional regulator n=1 Tax=Streptomyces sp. NPDC058783 TaxID=3346633 RepID=UPI0036CE9CF0
MKTLRLRAGLEREEFGRRIGYSAATVASYEQGRRIPAPRTVERADEVLDAGGLLTVWKEHVERAQYPVFFQGMAALEKEAIELLAYDTLMVKGLLQTEDYMRAVLGMRRPPLNQETIGLRSGDPIAGGSGRRLLREVAGRAMNAAESSAAASDLTWYKSSYSGAEGGDCLEIAAGTPAVLIRDSKAVPGPVIRVSREAWAGFIRR